MNFTLILSFNLLTNFNINLYKVSDYDGPTVNEIDLLNNVNELNSKTLAIDLALALSNFDGVSKIDILNKNNETLLVVGPTA
jgi:hypothetical protein